MALLALQDASNGASLTFVAAAGGGDTVPSGSKAGTWQLPVALVVRNGGASPIDVTVAGGTPVSVAAGGAGVFPINHTQQVGDPVAVTYSGVTTVTVAAARLYSV